MTETESTQTGYLRYVGLPNERLEEKSYRVDWSVVASEAAVAGIESLDGPNEWPG